MNGYPTTSLEAAPPGNEKPQQPPVTSSISDSYADLIDAVCAIRADLLHLEERYAESITHIHPKFRASARNFLHYVALRRRDQRPLQTQLARLGLSSLGRAESHVLATLDAVLGVLCQLTGQAGPAPVTPPVDFDDGPRLLAQHTEDLLGPKPLERQVHIMVTMPSEAADDYVLVESLVKHGMNCMRINCAHDSPAEWGRMIDYLRRAEQATQRRCLLLMDLAGPKLRTGPMEAGPAVVKVRPRRNSFGSVLSPARLWLTDQDRPVAPPSPADATLPVPQEWLRHLALGDRIDCTDTRGAQRTLRVVDVALGGCWAEIRRTAYFASGTELICQGKPHGDQKRRAPIGEMPRQEMTIPLRQGDLLILTSDQQPGRAATYDSGGLLLSPAHIGCTAPEIFADVNAGERIRFDDGKIGGMVEKREADALYVRITQTRMQGGKLGSDKGINLPDSHLRLKAITQKDRQDLTFIMQHADMVALSFVNDVQDVRQLQELMQSVGGEQPAIVLKVETKRCFDNLPAILLETMRTPRCGVMIARGDLAVECGFERLAEVQEEILWLCEAAHVPVIWATQVLESLAKDGIPSRAEISDAAMAHRAECVMLNKGPYIVEAVLTLEDILRRMHGHQSKKLSMLRELRLASGFRFEEATAIPTVQIGENE